MLKKLVLGTLVFGLIGNVAMAEEYVTKTEFNRVADDVYDLHNDQLMLHLQQQKEIEQIKKGMQDISNLQYDDTNIKNDITNINSRIDSIQHYDDTELVKQIDTIKQSNDKLQGEVQNNTKLLNSVNDQLQGLQSDFNNFKSETRKGIASAVAIAGLEKPQYDPNHKVSLMVGTGSYKGTTVVAYGVTYQPNYDMVFSIKGSDDTVACSMGVNL